jgi:hypothetical protein
VTESNFPSGTKLWPKPVGKILHSDIRDDQNLGIVTKHNQTKATNALISAVGHITQSELVRHLHETEMASGFANRFLFACVKRARLLPTGGSLSEEAIIEMAGRVKEAVGVRQANQPCVSRR